MSLVYYPLLTRKRVRFLILKMIWQVRIFQDKNLLIVHQNCKGKEVIQSEGLKYLVQLQEILHLLRIYGILRLLQIKINLKLGYLVQITHMPRLLHQTWLKMYSVKDLEKCYIKH